MIKCANENKQRPIKPTECKTTDYKLNCMNGFQLYIIVLEQAKLARWIQYVGTVVKSKSNQITFLNCCYIMMFKFLHHVCIVKWQAEAAPPPASSVWLLVCFFLVFFLAVYSVVHRKIWCEQNCRRPSDVPDQSRFHCHGTIAWWAVFHHEDVLLLFRCRGSHWGHRFAIRQNKFS